MLEMATNAQRFTKDEVMKTNFDAKAATWDDDPKRIKRAGEIADAMIRAMHPATEMDAMDFGCGSGLITLMLQPLVKSITGVDSSREMLNVLENKIKQQKLANVRTQFVDIEAGDRIEGSYDLIVSSMTLHHVSEPGKLLRRLYNLLFPGGQLGIADLDTEDGTFHSDNTGVVHFGFERAKLKELFTQAGFREIRDATASTVVREQEGKTYTVFLISGTKK
jgi:2-polyprenyl-3-methyl-5-hydroxy-6-metoxy-1,4-benzoquinol methylase